MREEERASVRMKEPWRRRWWRQKRDLRATEGWLAEERRAVRERTREVAERREERPKERRAEMAAGEGGMEEGR